MVCGGSKYAHKFFDAIVKRWSLILLFEWAEHSDSLLKNRIKLK